MTSVNRRPPSQPNEAHGDSNSVVSARFVAKRQPSSGNGAEEYPIYPYERDPCVKVATSVKFSLASHVPGAGWREAAQETSCSFGTAAIWGRVPLMGTTLFNAYWLPEQTSSSNAVIKGGP